MAIRYVEKILNTENIGNSLVKINNNFVNLQTALCDLQKKVNSAVNVRTFFYYGPNSATDPTSNMQNNITSRPSNATIESFVNTQLNVPDISKTGDIVYVVYQKTGYRESKATRITKGTATASNGAVVPWSTTSDDIYTSYAPTLIIWRLICSSDSYKVDLGFPKTIQAQTLSTTNWNNPQNWLQY